MLVDSVVVLNGKTDRKLSSIWKNPVLLEQDIGRKVIITLISTPTISKVLVQPTLIPLEHGILSRVKDVLNNCSAKRRTTTSVFTFYREGRYAGFEEYTRPIEEDTETQLKA